MRHLALALALLASSAARAEEAKPAAGEAKGERALRAWELDAFLGYGQLAWHDIMVADYQHLPMVWGAEMKITAYGRTFEVDEALG